jgi:hypothetical protein
MRVALLDRRDTEACLQHCAQAEHNKGYVALLGEGQERKQHSGRPALVSRLTGSVLTFQGTTI